MDSVRDKVVQVMKLLYDYSGEIIINISREKTLLFLNIGGSHYEIPEEVINILLETEIIEHDSGSVEEEHETLVFMLTDNAQKRIKEILHKTENMNGLPAP